MDRARLYRSRRRVLPQGEEDDIAGKGLLRSYGYQVLIEDMPELIA
jgi:hypothetical protein